MIFKLIFRSGSGGPSAPIATYQRPQKKRGFTLIELMIVVAIIAILSAIAYPSYTQYVLKGNRAEGRGALLNLLQQEEAYITQHGTYLTFAAGDTSAPFRAFSNDNADPNTAAYKLGATNCASSTGTTPSDCVKVFAVPVRADPKVRQLQVESTGKRSCTGTDPTECW